MWKFVAMRFFHFLICLFTVSIAFGQSKFEADSVFQWQREMNLQFADSLKSPLTKTDLATFSKLDFYVPNETFFIQAKLVKTPNAQPFEMHTTTARKPKYVKYGILHFTIDGKKHQLNVYQSADVPKNPLYKNHLFLPFTDRTSGVDTYGGGRYIDLLIPKGNQITIDFNKAYNPYCAYNVKYSCPIVPQENDLNVEILAGVKKFKK